MNDFAWPLQNQKSEWTLPQNGIYNVSLEHTLRVLLSNNVTHRKSSLFNSFQRKYSDFIKLGKGFTSKEITDKKKRKWAIQNNLCWLKRCARSIYLKVECEYVKISCRGRFSTTTNVTIHIWVCSWFLSAN